MQPHLSQNYHLVGGPSHFAPFNLPQSMEDTPSEEDISTPPASMFEEEIIS